MNKRLLLSFLTVATLACASQPAPPAASAAPQCNPGLALVNASLWAQSAVEYKATTMQTYVTARRLLDNALADPTWSAIADQTPAASMPTAVILDLDETAIDNSAFEARMVREGKSYSSEEWAAWVAESRAAAVPGAKDFLEYARSRGVTPFYITNRKSTEKIATRRNLEALGFPLELSEDTLLVRGEREEWNMSDKTPRRQWVASRYRVLLLLGDDMNDFVSTREKTLAQREAILGQTATNWGTKWLMLPNPMYGSWESTVAGEGTGCEQLQRKIDALRP